ncbi:metallophosphoesterase [Lacticaseibacillus yichunensis]|uniref:Metallophosphoesterase n=1 Tax=Lacticaseibacillus yichunensis TaxID=2486015 RepID=A0ABW4CT38_9LACO|nr:metallophosphoesterase [Lacticaseibacillus yichunensis]
MRIAISVDDHLDINKVDEHELIPRQAELLVKRGVALYLNAGDTYNDFGKTLAYFRRLQEALGTAAQVRFIAGNHDLVNGISYEEAQSDVDPLYLHEKTLRIPGNETVVIGNNGWYDYSLAEPPQRSDAAYATWKRAYWIDGQIPQPVSDRERMARVLATTEQALLAAQGKRVLYLTHFVPHPAYIYFTGHRMWQMATALMGSAQLGALLARYGVWAAAFGHLHKRDTPWQLDGVTYYHQPVGYGMRRRFEWQSHDFFTEWEKTLVVLDV